MRRLLLPVFLLINLIGCIHRPARFVDAPPVKTIFDDTPIPCPSRREFREEAYLSEVYLRRPLVDFLDPSRYPPAADVNALDEVPACSWFNPIPLPLDGPPVPPITAVPEGTLAWPRGLSIIDSRGLRYELRRDPADRPDLTTSAAFIASRLIRLFGLNAPEVAITSLHPSDLADFDPVNPGKLPAPFDGFFANGPPAVSGAFRCSATRWPFGEDVGISPASDERPDDPNDTIPHRDRRVLRSLKVLGAWLAIDDMGPTKTRDAYVGPPGQGHLLHFIVELEDALGASSIVRPGVRKGLRTDLGGGIGKSLISLGLWPGVDPSPTQTQMLAVGQFSDSVSPAEYGPSLPYPPITRILAPDGYWAAKRIATITRSQVNRAVSDAEIKDQASADELIRIILARRDKVVAYWFLQVTPAEVSRIQGNILVMKDMAVGYEMFLPRTTTYTAQLVDDHGKSLSKPIRIDLKAAEFPIELPKQTGPVLRRFVLRMLSHREGIPQPRTMDVHLVPDETGSYRVIGVQH